MKASTAPLTLMLGIALAGCADFESPADPSGGAPDVLVEAPSFTANVLPILEKRCSIGGCHSFASRQGGLDLTGDSAYAALVNIAARQNPNFSRVRPFRPDSSWLVRVLSDDAAQRGGFPRMPLSSAPLTPNQIGTVVNWILRGAPND